MPDEKTFFAATLYCGLDCSTRTQERRAITEDLIQTKLEQVFTFYRLEWIIKRPKRNSH